MHHSEDLALPSAFTSRTRMRSHRTRICFLYFQPSSDYELLGKDYVPFCCIPSTYYSQPFGYGSVSSLSKGMNELNQSHVPFDAIQVSDKQHSQLLAINIPDTTWIPKVFMHPLKKRSHFRRYLAKS